MFTCPFYDSVPAPAGKLLWCLGTTS